MVEKSWKELKGRVWKILEEIGKWEKKGRRDGGIENVENRKGW